MAKKKRTPSPQPQKTKKTSSKKNRSAAPKKTQPGQLAQAGNQSLRTWTVGSLPLINGILERMDLHRFLETHLRPDGARTLLPTASALLVLVRNLLVSREPIYGVGEWAARYAPDLLDLSPEQLDHFNDDRLGRCLDRLFATNMPDLILAVVRHVVQEFDLDLEELHNDSTTVTFSGAYDEAEEEGMRQGRKTLAITYGHNKDHRPDLKQLLYVLTVTEDGGVPVFFTAHSGNVVDDQTHRQTWDLLHQLIGSADFLYVAATRHPAKPVAGCPKLASTENLQYIAKQNGRFITVLPGSRKEDRQFKERLLKNPEAVSWDLLDDVHDKQGQLVDRLRVFSEELLTKEGGSTAPARPGWTTARDWGGSSEPSRSSRNSETGWAARVLVCGLRSRSGRKWTRFCRRRKPRDSCGWRSRSTKRRLFGRPRPVVRGRTRST